MSIAQLDALFRRLEALDHSQTMLGLDEAINMPDADGDAFKVDLEQYH